MIIRFANDHIKKICNDYRYALKSYPKVVCDKLCILMYQLASVEKINSFQTKQSLRKYRLHQLKGDKQGILSLSVDRKYRMELVLEIEKIDGEDIIKILEVSNHYGDWI